MVRTKIRKYYVERNRKGQIKNWVKIGRALARDRGTKARTKVRSGYGNVGDQMAWGM
jgi:hypothetical protein